MQRWTTCASQSRTMKEVKIDFMDGKAHLKKCFYTSFVISFVISG